MLKNFYCFSIKNKFSLDEAWQQLEQAGIEVAYGSEEESEKRLYGYWEATTSLPEIKCIKHAERTTLPEIDWEAQWATHGANFYEGCVHVDLGASGQMLRLQPGPGFGDLSHPTTRLVLNFLSEFVSGKPFIDIGCGSGILALAACQLGASHAYGIDIDPEALEHADANAQLNQLENKCTFYLAKDFHAAFKTPVIIAMNMISSEQKEAWPSLPSLHHLSGVILTSGIRQEEREDYLKMAAHWGWTLMQEKKEEGWLLFQFMLKEIA